MAVLLAVSACACALADATDDDFEYEGGDPQFSPELTLRCDPDAGCDWTIETAHEGVTEPMREYLSLQAHPELDAWGNEDGGYLWVRLDGTREGVDTVTLRCTDENAPIARLTLVVHVDAAWNARILAIGTDDVAPPETLPEGPIHPVMMLSTNPATGHSWLPDNSYTEGLTISSEFIPDETGGVEHVTLEGKGGDITNATFSFAREWETDGAFLTLRVGVRCDEDTGVNLASLSVGW